MSPSAKSSNLAAMFNKIRSARLELCNQTQRFCISWLTIGDGVSCFGMGHADLITAPGRLRPCLIKSRTRFFTTGNRAHKGIKQQREELDGEMTTVEEKRENRKSTNIGTKKGEREALIPLIVSAEGHQQPGSFEQKLCGGPKCVQL